MLYFRRNSIVTKIILTSWFLIVLSVLLNGFFAYRYSHNILKQQYVDAEEKQLNAISRQFSVLTEDVKRIALSEALDSQIQQFLINPLPEDSYLRYSMLEKIRTKLSMLSVQRDYIASIAIIRNDKELRGENIVLSNMKTDFGGDEEYFKDALKESWYTRIPESSRDFFSSRFTMELAHGTTEIVPYVLRVFDMDNPDRRIGEIIIALRYESLQAMLAQPLEGMPYFYWLDPYNAFLYSNTPDVPAIGPERILRYGTEAEKKQLSVYEDRDFGYLFVDKLVGYDWTFISAVSHRSISEHLRPIVYYFIVLTVLIMLFSMLLLMPVIATITRPLSSLAEAMSRVSEGDMDASIEIKTNDEVNELAHCFNTMLTDIKDYIRRIGEHEKIEKDMQQSLLLAQINPHFIYNTLQTIVYMAKKAGAEDIVEMTNSFISVLQNIVRIGHGSVTTTLFLELEGIRHYMAIQSYRYRGKFNLSVNVDESLLTLEVPRSILQPLVENSLYHGILSSQHVGQIDIGARIENDNLIIEVNDDGCGIPPERLEGLLDHREVSSDPGDLPSIGLINLNDRIRFLYGSDYGLQVLSEVGSYTSVSLSLPAQTITGN